MANGFNDDDDKTILLPSPGVRRPTPGGAPGGESSRLPKLAPDPRAHPQPQPGELWAPGGSEVSPEDFIAGGRNPLLAAAGTLLVIGARLKTSVAQADLSMLREQASAALVRFSEGTRTAGVPEETIDVASYVLCTFFDTSVMRTPWGARGEWGKHSLLVAFHNEAFGGEKFFQIADRALAEPERYIDLIELIYICIALGYEGRFADDAGGRQAINDYQSRLFRVVRDLRGEGRGGLSVRWSGTDAGAPVRRIIPVWAAVAGVLLAVFFTWASYRQLLNRDAQPILEALVTPVGPMLFDAVETEAMDASRVKIRSLLASEEEAGRIMIEESNGQTTIVVSASDLFASASASLTAKHLSTIDAIASAINAVPGRVIVVGHTDSQPLRSFRFSDNFALSRARAQTVGALLEDRVEGSSRIEVSGAGSTQPRFLPPDLPENQARNRRVELIHVARSST